MPPDSRVLLRRKAAAVVPWHMLACGAGIAVVLMWLVLEKPPVGGMLWFAFTLGLWAGSRLHA